jgi:kanamycin kinase
MAIAAIPTGEVPVPAVVAAIAGDDAITPVWRNERGGVTFRLAARSGDERYAKWVASGTPGIDLAREAHRLDWAAPYAAVPRVLETGADSSAHWLVTAGLPGHSAVDPRWIADPQTAVRAIGAGLRVLHDALPVDDCPFDWSVGRRLARVDERIAAGGGPADWAPEHAGLSVADARGRLAETPPVDRLVVCHGDACAPNTLLDRRGRFLAHVDLGSLGVADQWADIAVAAWSTEWNYGPGLAPLLYEGYGIAADPERIAYYRLLWDLG